MASPGWGSPSSSWFCFSSLILQRDKDDVRRDQQIWWGDNRRKDEYLCRQRRRNLMIFLAAWSCFLVRKEPLVEDRKDEETSHNTQASLAFSPLGDPSREGQGAGQ